MEPSSGHRNYYSLSGAKEEKSTDRGGRGGRIGQWNIMTKEATVSPLVSTVNRVVIVTQPWILPNPDQLVIEPKPNQTLTVALSHHVSLEGSYQQHNFLFNLEDLDLVVGAEIWRYNKTKLMLVLFHPSSFSITILWSTGSFMLCLKIFINEDFLTCTTKMMEGFWLKCCGEPVRICNISIFLYYYLFFDLLLFSPLNWFRLKIQLTGGSQLKPGYIPTCKRSKCCEKVTSASWHSELVLYNKQLLDVTVPEQRMALSQSFLWANPWK